MSEIVAVLIPVYRNDDTIEELAERAIKCFEKEYIDFRLVFIVDASPDCSWEIVSRLALNNPRIVGINLAVNVGQHSALITGLRNIVANWYMIMDADLQDPPELLTTLLRKAKQINGTVFAKRQGLYQRIDRMITSRLHKKLLSLLTGLPETTGTFFVFNKDVAERICSRTWYKPHMVILAKRFSTHWELANYQRRIRPRGKSAYSFFGRLRAALEAYMCVWESRKKYHDQYNSSSKHSMSDTINLC